MEQGIWEQSIDSISGEPVSYILRARPEELMTPKQVGLSYSGAIFI